MYQGALLEFLNMGGGEIFVIGIVILLLFGGKKLPELARGLGKGIREFKDASEGVKREIQRNINSVTTDEEEKKEESNYSNYHHPTEDQQLQSTADVDYNHSEGSQPHLDEPTPEKGKESHIE
jgi:sec-independent protein translocase protein TatA